MKKQSLFSQRIKEAKQQTSTEGFPPVFKVEEVNSSSKAKFYGVSIQEYEKIQQENAQALQEMDQDKIAELQQELKATLGDRLVNLFQTGEIYREKESQQFQQTVQKVILNSDIYSEQQLIIENILALQNSQEISQIKIVLKLTNQMIQENTLFQLEEIKTSEYLISLISSKNLTLAAEAFMVLYKFWVLIVPDCWNSVYEYSIKSAKNLNLYSVVLDHLIEQQLIDLNDALDILRIQNILNKSKVIPNCKYNLDSSQLRLKWMILTQDFKDSNNLTPDNEFIQRRMREYKISQIDEEIISSPLLLNENLEYYTFIPFESILRDFHIGSETDIIELIKMAHKVRLYAKFIISRDKRRTVKWEILNCIRDLFKDQIQKGHSESIFILAKSLNIVITLGDDELYHEGSTLLDDYDASLPLTIPSIGDPNYFYMRYLHLLINEDIKVDLLSQLLPQIDIELLIRLLNKNVKYFERLLQKCTFDSYYQSNYVNALFMFIHPSFNPDFHHLLFQEFQLTPILNHLSDEIFTPYIDCYFSKPASDQYRYDMALLPDQNTLIRKIKNTVATH